VIGLHADIVLGLLEQGRTERAKTAEHILKRADVGNCFIHPLVLSEIARTLERDYSLDRAKVASYLDYILHAPEFTVGEAAAAFKALQEYRTGRAGFSDYLLAALNLAAGCEVTVTFAANADSAGFQRLAG
jgi:predicted nucleic-acid-binding protein